MAEPRFKFQTRGGLGPIVADRFPTRFLNIELEYLTRRSRILNTEVGYASASEIQVEPAGPAAQPREPRRFQGQVKFIIIRVRVRVTESLPLRAAQSESLTGCQTAALGQSRWLCLPPSLSPSWFAAAALGPGPGPARPVTFKFAAAGRALAA